MRAPPTSSSNKAIVFFSNSNDLLTSRKIFNQIPHPDVISWNSILSAYSRHGRHGEVLRLFKQMQSSPMAPTPTTLSTVLASCSEFLSLEPGRQLHAFSIKSGFSSNVYVGTSLITLYSRCLVPDSSGKVFEEVEGKNIACWNALISGLIGNGDIVRAYRIFDRMPERNVVSWTAMIAGLVREGRLEEAVGLFDLVPVKNIVTWSVILRGFVSDGRFHGAIKLFKAMVEELGFWKSSVAVILPVVVAACSGLGDGAGCGRTVHGQIVKLGFDADPEIEASLISMYFCCSEIEVLKFEFGGENSVEAGNSLIRGYVDGSRIDEARKIFDGMPDRDGTSWFLMISGYLKNNLIEPAVNLFSDMARPTVEICTVLVSALLVNGKITEARNLYDRMLKKDVILSTAMVSGYLSAGLLEEATNLFRSIPNPSVVTYNVVLSGLILHGKIKKARDLFSELPIKDEVSYCTMICGLVRSGRGKEAFLLLKNMMERFNGVRLNESAITSILGASASISALGQGESIHGLAIKLGFEYRLITANSLISMYSKCGEVDAARSVFDRTQNRDLISWNSMLHGYAVNGHAAKCFDLYEEMKKKGIKPDDLTFLAILSACVHTRLLEKSRQFLREMRSEHGINPRLPHYSCLIELLCKLGQIKEAEELVHLMPFKPDAIIWSSLLSGCTQNLQVDSAEIAADRLLQIDPRDPTPYLSLARIYAATGESENLKKLRKNMNAGRTIVRPGCSWIEINGKTFSFFAGDKYVSQSVEMVTHLEGLISRIKYIGCDPDYNLAIQGRENDIFKSDSSDLGEINEG